MKTKINSDEKCPLCGGTGKCEKKTQIGYDIGTSIGFSNDRFGGDPIYRHEDINCPVCKGNRIITLKKLTQMRGLFIKTRKSWNRPVKSKPGGRTFNKQFKEYLLDKFIR